MAPREATEAAERQTHAPASPSDTPDTLSYLRASGRFEDEVRHLLHNLARELETARSRDVECAKAAVAVRHAGEEFAARCVELWARPPRKGRAT
jgi:hypothetical protein